LRAIATVALIRSASVGARPVVGSTVTSPTVKIPNCMPDIRASASSFAAPTLACGSTSRSVPGRIPANSPSGGGAEPAGTMSDVGPAARRDDQHTLRCAPLWVLIAVLLELDEPDDASPRSRESAAGWTG
jgi:hypothetical protein